MRMHRTPECNTSAYRLCKNQELITPVNRDVIQIANMHSNIVHKLAFQARQKDQLLKLESRAGYNPETHGHKQSLKIL